MLSAASYIMYILLSQDFGIVSESQYWLRYGIFRIYSLWLSTSYLVPSQKYTNSSIHLYNMNCYIILSAPAFIMYILLS